MRVPKRQNRRLPSSINPGASSRGRGWPGRWLRSSSVMSLVGLLSAGSIFVSGNLLAARFFQRWDVTSAQLYTLSPPTIETLGRIDAPIEVVVLLSQLDPLTSSVRYLLDSYRAHTPHLQIRFVDPDRNPTEFIALQREYGLLEGYTADGRLASEASLVISQGDKHWFVGSDEIVAYDEASGEARPRLEQVLTEGIASVLERSKTEVCFTDGHRELSADSGGPQGLAEFRRVLEQNNHTVRSVDLGLARVSGALAGCDLVVVAGPSRPLSVAAAQELTEHVRRGHSLLLAIGPVVGDDGRILDPGLHSMTELSGIRFNQDLVFEREEQLAMPVGFGGEVFLATPREHAVTQGLLHGETVVYRVLVQLSQSLSLTATSKATAVLRSSDHSVAIDDFRTLEPSRLDELPALDPASRVLAVVSELGEFRAPGAERAARVAAVGTPSVLWSSTWLEPSLLGTRRFTESLVSWLSAQPALVSVPEKPAQPAGLQLSQAALQEVQRYVLLYMPGCAALIGLLVLLRRRHEAAPAPRSEVES